MEVRRGCYTFRMAQQVRAHGSAWLVIIVVFVIVAVRIIISISIITGWRD